ncbi:MAG: uroporphyrinogen decarboxylase, partial [Cytophagales bacterium]|nr:uroporphyrinogen decarboxylase [Cytophagales bacterium]
VKNVDAVTEVTIQPVDILGVDAAIIFSDILVIPEAMGLDYEMEESKGPIFPKTITDRHSVDNLLGYQAAENLSYVYSAIKQTKTALNNRVPLIGFAGAPWTIFAYMTEGSGSKTFSKSKKWLYNDPELSHLLLNKITDATIAYLKKQIESGADLVQIFDSWAGVLSPVLYEEFSLKYIRKICDSITEVPVTVFAKGAFFARKSLAATPCHVIGLDWNMSISESREIIGPHKTLQGNLDPCALYAGYPEIEKSVRMMLSEAGKRSYIANLGHGLYPDTDKDKVKFFVEKVKEISSSLPL